jgi:two-component system phosphate regulon response regulator PhoB
VDAEKGYTILVVEDSADTRLILVVGLQMQGFRVKAAANGREALDVLASEKCDVVLSDFHMPEMDGGELVEELRASPKTSDIPIILMTAMPTHIVGRLQVDAILRKPFTFEAVLRELHSVRRAVGAELSGTGHSRFMPDC